MTNSTTFPGSLSCATSNMSNAMTLGTTKTFVVTVSDGAFYIDGVIRLFQVTLLYFRNQIQMMELLREDPTRQV